LNHHPGASRHPLLARRGDQSAIKKTSDLLRDSFAILIAD
jgi:hypothetical protein